MRMKRGWVRIGWDIKKKRKSEREEKEKIEQRAWREDRITFAGSQWSWSWSYIRAPVHLQALLLFYMYMYIYTYIRMYIYCCFACEDTQVSSLLMDIKYLSNLLFNFFLFYNWMKKKKIIKMSRGFSLMTWGPDLSHYYMDIFIYMYLYLFARSRTMEKVSALYVFFFFFLVCLKWLENARKIFPGRWSSIVSIVECRNCAMDSR